MKKYKIVVFQGKDTDPKSLSSLMPQKYADHWYWHIKAPNGKIVADGAEAYEGKGNATRAAHALARAFLDGRVEGP